MNAPRRLPRLKVDGVLLLDKPSGITSNAALQRVRRAFNAAKAGHTGTLDPLASGLLPVCLGEATKFSQTLLDADKAYLATLRLGVRTTTGDAEGSVVETRPVSVSSEDLEAACMSLRGVIDQVPPMYSALKVAGRPLYDYARSGVELERKSRSVVIRRLDIVAFEHDRVSIAVDCSKGTYIRVLAEDLGHALGCGAHLVELRRTRIGPFALERAVALDAVEQDPDRPAALLPVDALLEDWQVLDLEQGEAERFMHGQRIRLEGVACDSRARRCRVYGQGRFLGAGELAEGVISPLRLVSDSAFAAESSGT